MTNTGEPDEPLRGRRAVLVDDVDLRQLHPEVLWNRIGLVPQKPYLFTGTVASNLRYGKPDATEEEIREAAPKSTAMKSGVACFFPSTSTKNFCP